MHEVSAMEVSMIQNLMLTKTNKEISTTLDMPVDTVTAVVRQLQIDTGLISRQVIIDQNRKPRAVKQKDVKPAKGISSHSAELVYHEQRKKDMDRRRFATIPVDLNKMQSVRIDDKTTIFIKPGESALEARMNYLDREQLKKKKLFTKE